ncbi:lamin-B1 [Aegotheles albertisi]
MWSRSLSPALQQPELRWKRKRGHGHGLAWAEVEEMARSLQKETLAAPQGRSCAAERGHLPRAAHRGRGRALRPPPLTGPGGAGFRTQAPAGGGARRPARLGPRLVGRWSRGGRGAAQLYKAAARSPRCSAAVSVLPRTCSRPAGSVAERPRLGTAVFPSRQLFGSRSSLPLSAMAAAGGPPGQRGSGLPAGTRGSSVRMSRLQERGHLQQLNERLASYIDKVRNLESKNGALRQKVTAREALSDRELGSMRAVYKAELADALKAVEDTARERAKLQVELRLLRHNQLQLWKRLSFHCGSLPMLKCISLICKRRQCDKSNFEENFALQAALTAAKDQLADETLKKIDLENRCQTLAEDLEFRKSMHKEVNASVSRIHIFRGKKTAEYENKLAKALSEMKKQQEAQMKLYKKELEQFYYVKLKNATIAAKNISAAADSVNERLRESTKKVENLTSLITKLQKESIESEKKVQELQEELTKEREDAHKALLEKNKQIAEIKTGMRKHLSSYENLLDVKLALDTEIGSYRKLLESEEDRLKIALNPPSQGEVSQSSSHSVHTTKAKRRRIHVAESGASGSVTISHSASTRGGVCIEEIDIDGKFIRLRNASEQNQPTGSWEMVQKIGDTSASYKYTQQSTVNSGRTVKIWAARAGVAAIPPTDLIWKNHKTLEIVFFGNHGFWPITES